jgi:hypothetical protein
LKESQHQTVKVCASESDVDAVDVVLVLLLEDVSLADVDELLDVVVSDELEPPQPARDTTIAADINKPNSFLFISYNLPIMICCLCNLLGLC